MTSPLRRKRPITRSSTATAHSAVTWLASLAIALSVASADALASETASQPSILKIRSVGSSAATPAHRAAKTAPPTTLKKLAHAAHLQPTPAPAPPMFADEVDQVGYEEEEYTGEEAFIVEEEGDVQLVQTNEELRREEPQVNRKDGFVDCKIKNQRAIGELTDATQASGTTFPPECPAPFTKPFEPRSWEETTFMWKASALCHKPLYFEDVQLERYGHSWGPVVQPVISGAEFFATVPILPYKMGVELPWECVYPLGYYRPGDCSPYMIPPIPVSVRGAVFQGAATAGGILLIP